MKDSKFMKLWTHPDNYLGETWYDYYVAYGHSRDSDLLTESNWDCFVTELKAIPESVNWERGESQWTIVRNSHWAVGWVEFIAIHKEAEAHIAKADELLGRIEDYPVLDEEDWSQRKSEAQSESAREAVKYWAGKQDRDYSMLELNRIEYEVVNNCEGGEDWYPSDQEIQDAVNKVDYE